MNIDFSGCKSAVQQEALRKACKNVLESAFNHVWANFHAPKPYVIAYNEHRWKTFGIDEAGNLTM